MVDVLLTLHLIAALAGVVAFWIAAASVKGGSRHRSAGRSFRRAIYLAAVVGGVLAVIGLVNPALITTVGSSTAARASGRHFMFLLLYLLMVIVAPVQHGICVVAAGAQPARIRSVAHLMINSLLVLLAFVLFPAGIVWRGGPFLLVTPVGFAIGLRNMVYANRQRAAPAEWEREHLTSMITAGIAVHTALFALTAVRLPQFASGGAINLLPWLGPAAVGLPIMLRLRRTRSIDHRPASIDRR
jgi:hypothetical protein